MLEYFLCGVVFNLIFLLFYIIYTSVKILKLHPIDRLKLTKTLKEIKKNEFQENKLVDIFNAVSILIPFYKMYLSIIGIYYLKMFGESTPGLIYSLLKIEHFAILSNYKYRKNK